MNNTAKRKPTYEDILNLPADVTGEILGGELYTQPRPSAGHAFVETMLTGDLTNPFVRGRGGPGGWWILIEPELRLQDDVLVPDIAGWRTSRLPEVPNQAAITIAPDWVCEILSPSTRRKDRMIKLPTYLSHGVEWAWMVDPLLREIEVFESVYGAWTLRGTHGDVDKVCIAPFAALELDLSLIWPTGE